LAELLHLGKHTKSALRRNETGNNFLSHVLGGRSQQVFQLDRTELLDYRALLADALVEALLELVELTLLLIEVFNQTTASFLHFVKTTLKALNDADHWPVDLPAVLGVPDVVSNELFDGLLPLILEEGLVAHNLQLVHQAVDILDQDVVARYQNFLLLTRARSLGLARPTFLLGRAQVGFV